MSVIVAARVFKTKAHVVPHQLFQRQRLVQLDVFHPASLAFADLQRALRASQDLIFRIQDLQNQLSRAGPRRTIRNGDMQDAMRVSSRKISASRLKAGNHNNGGSNDNQRRKKTQP